MNMPRSGLTWESAVSASGAAAAARCEHSSSRDAPSVAICIAGAARSFNTPLVQAHLRHHFVQVLAGHRRSRLFLHLKTQATTTIKGDELKLATAKVLLDAFSWEKL